MAETAPVVPAAAPAKAPKKKTTSKPKKTGPSVSDLIVEAVSASKERHGLSLAGLKKALIAGGYDVEKNNARVKLAVKSLKPDVAKKATKSPKKVKPAAKPKKAAKSPKKPKVSKSKVAKTVKKAAPKKK
ncbi:H1 protein, partial [Polypterus senegalus]